MDIVVLGAGPAGVSLVETIRQEATQHRITMLTAEPFPPYSPPALADHFLHGSNAHLWRGTDWDDRMGVELLKNTKAVRIATDEHYVVLDNGKQLPYDRLVIATGSSLYAPIEGIEFPNVYNFKSLSAAQALVAEVKSGTAQNAVIVGAGFIGMEIALLLVSLGIKVIQVEMLDQVMATMLDKTTAQVALNLMRKRGIDVRLNTKAKGFIGNGKAEAVQLENGDMLPADIFIAATGVKPNTAFLEGSKIKTRWGISVDSHLRTNIPDVYAAGDVAETRDLLTGEEYVHAIFPNAIAQGKVVGQNLLGHNVEYAGAERMNSLKHLGLPIMAVGLKQGDEIIQRSWDGKLRTIYLQNHKIVGFQLVGEIQSAGILHSLLVRQADVRPIKHILGSHELNFSTMVWKAISGTPVT